MSMFASDLDPSEYGHYYRAYIEAAGSTELIPNLEQGRDNFVSFLESIPTDKLTHRYAADKWTVAEVVQHIIDAERVFQYRAFRFARNDNTPLPGFDQDTYVPESKANGRKLENILEEFIAVRNATLKLFGSFDKHELGRIGVASNAQMSVRALGFVICGHQEHHKKILEERYLQS